jgi:hypothetical protein
MTGAEEFEQAIHRQFENLRQEIAPVVSQSS